MMKSKWHVSRKRLLGCWIWKMRNYLFWSGGNTRMKIKSLQMSSTFNNSNLGTLLSLLKYFYTWEVYCTTHFPCLQKGNSALKSQSQGLCAYRFWQWSQRNRRLFYSTLLLPYHRDTCRTIIKTDFLFIN